MRRLQLASARRRRQFLRAEEAVVVRILALEHRASASRCSARLTVLPRPAGSSSALSTPSPLASMRSNA
jgi:hypothetical protein